jgi:Protein of unknown function (DUF3396)
MQAIRSLGPDGIVLVRDSWFIVFFLPNPFPPHAASVRAVFDLWRSVAPSDAIKWAFVGASAEQVKAVGPKTLDQCAAMLNPETAGKREMTSFVVFGPKRDGPDHLFHVVGDRTTGKGFAAGLAGFVECRLPTDFMTPDAVTEFAGRFADILPYVSGYCSPALATGPGGDVSAAGRASVGLAMRHPGYDVPRTGDSRFYIKDRVIGARWLTFLGPHLASQLGGAEALAAALPGVTLVPAGHGLMLRAGAEPEIGDVNRRVDTPLLRVVARALEPVTCFGNRGPEALVGGDSDGLNRWERRFLS